MSTPALWAEQIKRAAATLAAATEQDIARLNPTALVELDYWMVDAARALTERTSA